MQDKPLIEYAQGDYRERLKPFLLWMIVAAGAAVTVAVGSYFGWGLNRVVE